MMTVDEVVRYALDVLEIDPEDAPALAEWLIEDGRTGSEEDVRFQVGEFYHETQGTIAW
jgi:hypothetical protein